MPLTATARAAVEAALLDLLDQAALLQAAPADLAGSDASLAPYRRCLVALRESAAAQRLMGLQHLTMLLALGLEQRRAQPLSGAEQEALADAPVQLMALLLARCEQAAAAALLAQLQALPWFPQLPAFFGPVILERLEEDAAAFADSPQGANDTDCASAEDEAPAFAFEFTPTPAPIAAAPAAAPSLCLPPQPESPALVAREELDVLCEALAALPHEIPTGPLTPATLDMYTEQLGFLCDAVDAVGLQALHAWLQGVRANAQALLQGQAALTPECIELLHHWPLQAIDHLADPSATDAAQALAELMTHPHWPLPAAPGHGPAWVAALTAVQLVQARPDTTRPLQASASDLDLSVPADVDRAVLDSLLIELPQHAQAFSALAQRLAEGGTLAELEDARRVAHTLKGASNTVGIQGIAHLTHALEDILVALGRAQRLPSAALRALLLEAADTLEAMSEAVLAGASAPAECLALYQQVLDWAQRIDTEGLPAEDSAPLPSVPTTTAAPSMAPAPAATQAAAETAESEEPQTMLRVPAALVDGLLQLAGESAILLSQLQDRIAQLGQEMQTLRNGARQFSQWAQDLEQLVDVRGAGMQGGPQGGLDALEMDQYNELHMLSRRIVEFDSDQREVARTLEHTSTHLRELLAQKERLGLELQRQILRARMVEVGSVTPRIQRTVRQAARMLGKPVQLHIDGEQTLVDTQWLQHILDPLMHLLRNAVDHGIEDAATRAQRGKPEQGQIRLRFASSGAHIVLRCEDDGQGLDRAAIRQQALAQGLIGADSVLSDEQTLRLVLLPGFSTRSAATMLSGRGLGMDLVQRAVADLRGTLDIHSTAGQGSVFEMQFPLQLSATQVMVSRSAQHVLALSVRGVEQILPADGALQSQDDGSLHYLLQGQALPALPLEQLLALPAQALHQAGSVPAVMVVRDAQRQRCAVLVPELSDSRNVVVKPLHALLARSLGVDGSTILGDGAVAPVLDLPDLLRAWQAEGAPPAQHSGAALSARPLCLVVDDSVSVRRTMEQLMQDAGFEVLAARDGVEALGLAQRRCPQVVIADLEMPRMNGLELATALRQHPGTRGTPIVMITSRHTEKHRELALRAGVDCFLTKPYAEEQLLATIEQLLQPQAA